MLRKVRASFTITIEGDIEMNWEIADPRYSFIREVGNHLSAAFDEPVDGRDLKMDNTRGIIVTNLEVFDVKD
jgi:hypothetical protein